MKTKKARVEDADGTESDPIVMDKVFVSSYDDTNFDELVQNCFVVDDFATKWSTCPKRVLRC